MQGDICDEGFVLSLLREHAVDAVVHLAAESHVDRSIESPEEFITTNVIGTYRLLHAARQYAGIDGASGFRFRPVSTDDVYGSLGAEDPRSDASGQA